MFFQLLTLPTTIVSLCLQQGTAAFLGANGVGKMSGGGGLFDLASNMSPHNRNPLTNALSQSPLVAPFSAATSSSTSEIQRLREELVTNRAKVGPKAL